MKVISKILNPSGFFPNNVKLPVLHYVEAFNPNGPLAPLIKSLPLPKTDPVFGAKGPLLECWNH
jgi:uncharacterized protein YjlB